MNTFILEVWDDERAKTTFYTVRWDEMEESETDRFLLKFEKEVAHQEHLDELLNLILNEIGDTYGADDAFFNRYEDQVTALPSKPTKLEEVYFNFHDNPFRLYCLRLSSTIVILFGGGLKTTQTVQDDPVLFLKFTEANQFAKVIEECIYEKTLIVDHKKRTIIDPDYDEIVLP